MASRKWFDCLEVSRTRPPFIIFYCKPSIDCSVILSCHIRRYTCLVDHLKAGPPAIEPIRVAEPCRVRSSDAFTYSFDGFCLLSTHPQILGDHEISSITHKVVAFALNDIYRNLSPPWRPSIILIRQQIVAHFLSEVTRLMGFSKIRGCRVR